MTTTIKGDAVRRLRELLLIALETDTTENLAGRAGVPARSLYRVIHSGQEGVTFALADKLITHGLGDPALWSTEPELALEYGPDWEVIGDAEADDLEGSWEVRATDEALMRLRDALGHAV